jgi:predicted lipoprotein with Yx(FWY)xxD motif
VTYQGWPLYYFSRDTVPGDMRGQWVLNTWFTFNNDGTFNAKHVPYIGMASSPVGNTLVGPNGRTLYVLTKDTPGVSTCNGQCATFWPPLMADATPQTNKGVSGQFGTAKRNDGTMQATFNGMPLYYFLGDRAAGQWNGQSIANVWWMLTPTGTPITTKLPVFATLAPRTTPYGPILTGKNGKTVYILTHDANGQSVCYGQCAAIWPPVLSDISVITGPGINAKLVGTSKRTDGSNQVTYNGMPLYYYSGDKVPGDLTGQNAFSVWFVLRPSGKVLMPGDQTQ